RAHDSAAPPFTPLGVPFMTFRSPRPLALGAALATTLAAGATLAPSAGAAPRPVTISWERRGTPSNHGATPAKAWSPQYMDRSGVEVTREKAIADAQQFDVIWAKPRTYMKYVADMKAANPKLKLIAYANGSQADTPTEF